MIRQDRRRRVVDRRTVRVGTRWRETRSVYGRSAAVENCVTECEGLRRYTTEARVGARATSEFVFMRYMDGRQTSVRVSVQTRDGGLVYRLAEFLNRRRIRECVVEKNTRTSPTSLMRATWTTHRQCDVRM